MENATILNAMSEPRQSSVPAAGHAPDFGSYVMDAEGMFTVDRALFSEPAVFELEMQSIFERTWIYLAHESQLPHPHDFYTTTIGRQPVILVRNENGEIGCFINTCPHRGAALCQERSGHRKILRCPYHGWCFNSSGALVNLKDEPTGAYPDVFTRLDHGLTPVPRLSNYRGFLFGSLNSAASDLETHLGAARIFVDMIVDQAPEGMEVVKGSSDYSCWGNWKLQAENGVDGYHFDIVHRTFVGVVQRRAQSGKDQVRAIDIGRLAPSGLANGCYDLGNGHSLLWVDYPNPQDRPLYERRAEMAAKLGETRARWMMDRVRNLLIYPNVFLMDQVSTQIRVIHPLAVDKTRVSTYCIAPVNEKRVARARRLRQYEDFFNASGVGTPDDLAAFEACQQGYRGRLVRWQQGYVRGARRAVPGPDAEAEALGIRPLSSSSDFRDEIIFQGQYRQWLKLMNDGQGCARSTGNGR
jgi:benzoate/toluate 1,2-dioxygenase alpha subunit